MLLLHIQYNGYSVITTPTIAKNSQLFYTLIWDAKEAVAINNILIKILFFIIYLVNIFKHSGAKR